MEDAGVFPGVVGGILRRFPGAHCLNGFRLLVLLMLGHMVAGKGKYRSIIVAE